MVSRVHIIVRTRRDIFAKLWQSGLLFLYFNNVNKTMLDLKKELKKKSYYGYYY